MLATLLVGLGVPVFFAGVYAVYRAEMELPELSDLDEPHESWRDVFTWLEFLLSTLRFDRHPAASATFFAGLGMILVGSLAL